MGEWGNDNDVMSAVSSESEYFYCRRSTTNFSIRSKLILLPRRDYGQSDSAVAASDKPASIPAAFNALFS